DAERCEGGGPADSKWGVPILAVGVGELGGGGVGVRTDVIPVRDGIGIGEAVHNEVGDLFLRFHASRVNSCSGLVRHLIVNCQEDPVGIRRVGAIAAHR